MGAFDDFSSNLLEESKRFLEKANETSNTIEQSAYFHSAILIGMSALEAYINGICEELLTYPDYSISEKSLLSEREIEFKKGEFALSDKLKIYRLTDRIEYLYLKFNQQKLSGDNEKWWGNLKVSIDLRNKLVHPKESVLITYDRTKLLIESIIECLLRLSKIIYNKPFPFKNLGLQSKLMF